MVRNTIDHIWKIVLPIGIVILALILGFILQKPVALRLRRLARRTATKWDNVLIESLKGIVVLWLLLLGLTVALRIISLSPNTTRLFNTLLTLAAIFSVVIFLVRFSTRAIQLYTTKATGIPATIFKNVAAIILYLLGFLVMLDYLGISITPIVTALGIGGLAIALALQDTLSNLFSGVHILMTKKVRPGDYVRLQSGEEGYVTDITWRNTTIRALANNLIIIPNIRLISSTITNFHLPEREMAVLVEFGVSYESDLNRVEKVTREVGKEVMIEISGGVPNFEPFVRFHTFSDYSINGTVILRGKEFVDQFLIKHEFVKKLHERFRREGIEIPFPIRTVYLQKEEN